MMQPAADSLLFYESAFLGCVINVVTTNLNWMNVGWQKLYADSHLGTTATMIKFLCIHLPYCAAVCKNNFI
jgi:hypothetical protein